MPAPTPALKYQLLPELRELNPGNAAQSYLKCFMEQQRFFFGKESAAERARYQAMPLAALPVDKLLHYGGFALTQADWAARLDALDWQTLERIQNGGMERLSDEVGPFQDLAAALQVRLRAEVAGRHFDAALGTAKTLFALARHLGEHPTEVANLVGLWVAHLGLGTLEEMVQEPGCPNLYWALTDLPCPLVDLRKGVQGDLALVAAELRSLHDHTPMTETEMEEFVSHLSGVMGFAREQSGRSPRNVRPPLQARVNDPGRVRAARQRLIEAGYGPDLVKTFPPMQVILVDEKRDYEVQRDERIKLLALPIWLIDSPVGGKELTSEGDGLLVDLLPHIIKLRRTQGQLDQQIAFLRLVEALRMDAARHNGTLPAKVSDVSVPLPMDPVSGKPFVYAIDGAIAHIRGCSVQADEKAPRSNVHYEVRLQK
jgi:hypothetical protein